MPAEVQTNNFKSAIQTASGHVQFTVAKTETAALAAVDRVEGAAQSVRQSAQVGFDSVKAVGAELVGVIDNAGRTTFGGVAAINGSLMTYGKDLVTDTLDVGRKTIESRSLTDAVALQTAFAERRINALFHTVSAINSLAQTNVLAMWGPLASMLNKSGNAAAEFDASKKAA